MTKDDILLYVKHRFKDDSVINTGDIIKNIKVSEYRCLGKYCEILFEYDSNTNINLDHLMIEERELVEAWVMEYRRDENINLLVD